MDLPPHAAYSRLDARTRGADASSFFRRRPLFWAAFCFAAGIFCDDALLIHPAYTLSAAAVAGAALLAMLALSTRPHSRPRLFTGLLLCLALGAYWHAQRARIPPADDVALLPRGASMRLRGTLIDVEWQLGEGEELPEAAASADAAPALAFGKRPSTHWIVQVERVADDPSPPRKPVRGAKPAVPAPLPEEA